MTKPKSESQRYIETVGGAAHQSAVSAIERLEAEVAEYNRHLDSALRQAKEVCPDYPWSDSPTMLEIAWAVCSSLKGVTLACGDWKGKVARLQTIVDKLPKTKDGVPYSAYGDDRTFFAVWRDDENLVGPWSISTCHVPDDPDEMAMGFDWIIDDAEDECETLGIYSTREAAESAAKEAP